MRSVPYSVLASVYDTLMADVDYPAFADFYESAFRAHMEKKPAIVLDLGCGTGTLTTVLAERGYDMIGIDASPEMLSHAARRAEESGKNILYLAQDMRALDLYGTVDAAVCSLDCINYLTQKEDVAQCFASVHTFLSEGGLFIFDVNTVWKFESIFADNAYILEDEGVFVGWQNAYNEKTKLCRFYLSFFLENEDGTWERFEEEQRERAYSDKTLKKLLADAGFAVLGIYGDADATPATDTDERHFFVCKKCAR